MNQISAIPVRKDIQNSSSVDGIEARMHRLHEDIADYTAVKDSIRTGLDDGDRLAARKQRILDVLGGTEKDWLDYRWQLANRQMTAEDA